MGASSSCIAKNTLYISSNTDNTDIANHLTEHFERDGQYTCLEKDYATAYFLIICVSANTIRSVKQIKDIQDAWNEKRRNVIYLMTDFAYNPIQIPEIRALVQSHAWFPCYDEETLQISIRHIQTVLKNE